MIAFSFGFIDGLGFASALSGLSLPAGAMAASLGGFNVGVEIGQETLVLQFLPFAYLLRNTRAYRVGLVRWGSWIIIAIADGWLVQRAFHVLIPCSVGVRSFVLPERIRAHALICFLALVLYRVMCERLRASGSTVSARRANQRLAALTAKLGGRHPLTCGGPTVVGTRRAARRAAACIKLPGSFRRPSLITCPQRMSTQKRRARSPLRLSR